jgi:hypothetical protein
MSSVVWLVPAGHAIEEAPAPMVSWSELETSSTQRMGQRVRVQVQFHSPIASWNPFMTRFGSREFSAVRAWADEQFPWVAAEFESPAARLFTRRGSEAERVLASARPTQRFELDAVVREVFFDRPWVEVLAARPLTEFIGEGTVIHARRGIELAEAGAWELAEAEYERALTTTLPPSARAELERLRAKARAAIEDRTRPARAPSPR